ncbi:MAG: type II toxin-antitoxin system VapC family toxin [Planctomycetota bacterium]|nr:type II toxin-antitoxin system VapC family toxin [Planctomycetota bacterium]MDA1178563.1 type II toxin-antitoxin system VapC family toxin [Planctomycetota bacterium]
MKYLVDASVLSEATKSQPAPIVLQWLAEHDARLLVNPVILGELEYGIRLLPSGKKRSQLQEWFDRGLKQLNCIVIDVGTAGHWATLLADLKQKGKSMPVKDSLIAATAIQHDLIIATRNVADFKKTGVATVNPFEL